MNSVKDFIPLDQNLSSNFYLLRYGFKFGKTEDCTDKLKDEVKIKCGIYQSFLINNNIQEFNVSRYNNI